MSRNQPDLTLDCEQPKMTFKQLSQRISVSVLVTGFCVLLPACDKQADSTGATAANNPEVLELTKQVRRFSLEKRRLPQNLEELVTVGYIKSVPVAPAGKKYAIDANRAEVILVNH